MKLMHIITLLLLVPIMSTAARDCKKTIRNGKTIIIKLEGTAGTGYTWQYAVDAPDIVQVTAQDFKGDSKRMGTSGNFPFAIKGIRPGTAKITFGYSRPWENRIPLKQKTFTIVVK